MFLSKFVCCCNMTHVCMCHVLLVLAYSQIVSVILKHFLMHIPLINKPRINPPPHPIFKATQNPLQNI